MQSIHIMLSIALASLIAATAVRVDEIKNGRALTVSAEAGRVSAPQVNQIDGQRETDVNKANKVEPQCNYARDGQ